LWPISLAEDFEAEDCLQDLYQPIGGEDDDKADDGGDDFSLGDFGFFRVAGRS